MNIPYALRSSFTAPCQEGITAQQAALNAGQAVQIALKAGGYPGNIKVVVEAGKPTEFETDWSAGAPTRFPARIKAAATALRDCGCWGSFGISHADSIMSIVKVT